MNKRSLWVACGFGLAAGTFWAGAQSHSAASAQTGDGRDAEVRQLKEQVKQLQSLVPDQAAVMTHVAYHFTNLWVAIQQENWPLADFYQGEALNNINWAVRAKPIRKAPDGSDLQLAPIAQAIENTQFAELKKAIAAKDKAAGTKAYQDTLQGCYACHTASGKTYLKPHVPGEAEVRIIDFDPKAK